MPSVGIAINLDSDKIPGVGGVPPADSFILMETGDFILLESGDKILLE